MTTSQRSAAWMRKQGYHCEMVEHWRGRFRHDPFGFDCISISAAEPRRITGIQAYLATKKDIAKHAHLTPEKSAAIRDWIAAGGVFEHHQWYRKGRRWILLPVYKRWTPTVAARWPKPQNG